MRRVRAAAALDPTPLGLINRAEPDSNHETCRRRCGHPPGDAVGSGRVHRARHQPAGKIDDACRPAELLNAAENLLLLGAKPVGREDPIAIRVGFGAQAVHELDEVAVAGAALPAVEQVLGGGWVGRFARLLGEITVEESLFPQMM